MATVSTRRAIVFGGGSGIGAACVGTLADQGWTVLMADLQEPPAGLPAERTARVDVRDLDAMRAAVEELLGGGSVSGLVFAAGVGHVAPLTEISSSRWQLILDVNLTGAFNAIQSVLPAMGAGGSMAFVSSIDSERPVSGLAHYCAAKAGLDSLSCSAALELAPAGIRSNVVAPGAVQTPLMQDFFADPERREAFLSRTPLGTIATPEQIADTVAFLLSDASSHITGTRIPVDGGMSLREHPSML